MERNIKIALAGIVIVAIVVAAILHVSWQIHTYGRIKALGLNVYADAECTLEVSEINWGTISQGGTSSVTLFMRPTGTVLCNFTFTTESFSPVEAEQFLTLTWDYDGHIVQPTEVVQVVMTLHVATDTWGIYDFSFDLVITAVEVEV